jgi:hypothetical protein
MKRKVVMQKHRLLSTEAGDKSQTIPFGIVVEKVPFVSGFIHVPWLCPFRIISPLFQAHSIINHRHNMILSNDSIVR